MGKQKRYAKIKSLGYSLPTQKSQSGNTSISSNLYLICEKLPLDIYIDCWVDKDLNRLIISGQPTKEDIQKAWDKIFLQSLQLSQSGTYNESFEILKQIDDCTAKLVIVNNTVRHLSICNENNFDNDKELISVLNTLALRCNILPGDRGDILINKLNAIVGRAKKWIDKIATLRKTLDKVREENKETKIDREYFDSWLETISEFKGYFIKPQDITVSRFYYSIGQIREKNRQLELKKLKRG